MEYIIKINNIFKSVHFICWLCVVSIVLFYNYLYSFSFLPITEGWFTVFAKLMNNGLVPYNDFYLYLTPLYPLIIANFILLFGDSFISLRLFGFFITLMITTLLFIILSKRFKPIPSMFSSIVCMFYYQSGVAYISYDFTQILTLFILSSALMLILLIDMKDVSFEKYKVRISIYILLSGLFSSLAFFIKQSNGSMIVIASAIAAFYIVYSNYKDNLKIIIYYILGASIPFILVFLWLLYENALVNFIDQIFIQAISAKGDLDHILFGWIKGLFSNIFFIQFKTIMVWFMKLSFISLITYYISKKIILSKKLKFEYLYIFILIMFILISLFNSYYDYFYFNNKIKFYAFHYNNYLIPLVISVTTILSLFFISSIYFTKFQNYFNSKDVVFIIFSIGMIFGNGTSAGLSEIGIFLFLGYIFSYIMTSSFFKIPGSLLVVALGLSLIFAFSDKKFTTPYTWWGAKEPDVRSERIYSDINLLKDIKLSITSNNRFIQINNILKDYGDDKSVFAFPNIPMMYMLANNLPESKVVVPWFDFLPDKPAREEALRIKKSQPDVIINLLLPENAWSDHERLFRNNNRLGQRDIYDAINDLTLNKSIYRLAMNEELSNNLFLQIWTKK